MTPARDHFESYMNPDVIAERESGLVSVKNKGSSIFLIKPCYEAELRSFLFTFSKSIKSAKMEILYKVLFSIYSTDT